MDNAPGTVGVRPWGFKSHTVSRNSRFENTRFGSAASVASSRNSFTQTSTAMPATVTCLESVFTTKSPMRT